MIKSRKILKIGSYTPLVDYAIVETTHWGREEKTEETWVRYAESRDYWHSEEDMRIADALLKHKLNNATALQRKKQQFQDAKQEFMRACTRRLERPSGSPQWTDSTGQYTLYPPFTNGYGNNNTAVTVTTSPLFSPPY